MARRPTKQKQLRRLRKALRRTPPAYIDLIDWLKTRRHAQTSGQALTMLADGRVMSESHVVGRRREIVRKPDGKEAEVWVADPRVPAKLRNTLRVI